MRNRVILFLSIIVLILISIQFMPYRFNSEKNDNLYDKIKVDFEDSPDVILLEGKDILHNFCKTNNYEEKGSKFIKLSGANPIKEVTTFGAGIPRYMICYLLGNFECDSNGNIVFNVKTWYPADGDYPVYLVDTVVWREKYSTPYYVITVLTIISIIVISLYYIKKHSDK